MVYSTQQKFTLGTGVGMSVVQRISNCLNIATTFFVFMVGVSQAEWKIPPLYTATLDPATITAQEQMAYEAMIKECRLLKGAHECIAQVHTLSIVAGALATATQPYVIHRKKGTIATEYSKHVNEWSDFLVELGRAHIKGVFQEGSKPKRYACPFCDIG